MRNTVSIGLIVKNAAANVLRGSTAAIVAILLPPFLTRWLSPEQYGAWALVLQLSAYVGYLDFGLQTAVGRFVAHADERGDAEHRDRIISTSAFVLAGAAGLALILIATLTGIMPHLFPQMPHALFGDTRVAFTLVAVSLAIGLPASVFNGVFVGLQRNEVPALLIGGSRVISAGLLVLVVHRGGTIAAMGMVTAAVNIACYVLQWVAYRRLAPHMRLSRSLVDRTTGRELFSYCYSLTIWSFAMLLVTGLDLMMVGAFDYAAVPYYAVAASLVTFFAGLQSAIFTAVIPSAAVLHARGDKGALSKLLIGSTRAGALLLIITGIPLMLWAKPILSVWVRPAYAGHAAIYVQVLVLANIIRLAATPYMVALIATGQQNLITVSPLIEGLTNLATSIVGAYFFGAIGVALGTLVGGVGGLVCHITVNLPRTQEIPVERGDFCRRGLLHPILWTSPLLAFAAACRFGRGDRVGELLVIMAVALSFTATIHLLQQCRAEKWEGTMFMSLAIPKQLKRTALRILRPNPRGIRAFGQHARMLRPYTIEGAEYVEIGSRSVIREHAWLSAISEYAGDHFRPQINIGSNVYIGRYVCISAIGNVVIGDGCVLSEQIYISDHAHGLDPDGGPIMQQKLESKGPVIIGAGTFIGYGARLLPGVELGEHCVVGTNSVVTRSFPAYSMIAGMPARLIKVYDSARRAWLAPDSFVPGTPTEQPVCCTAVAEQ